MNTLVINSKYGFLGDQANQNMSYQSYFRNCNVGVMKSVLARFTLLLNVQ